MTKPDLYVVPTHEVLDDLSARVKIMALREKLMTACVRYIREGQSGTPQDRLRQASDMSGIPRLMLEAEVRNPLRQGPSCSS